MGVLLSHLIHYTPVKIEEMAGILPKDQATDSAKKTLHSTFYLYTKFKYHPNLFFSLDKYLLRDKIFLRSEL